MVDSTTVSCPALFFCAPASGQGKTTITAAIARYHRNQGRTVRVFKTGPDYMDPLVLERASGHPVAQLDLWMVGEAACKQMIYEAALEADLILIEGVMGMFDGDPSGADMAAYFGIPVAVVIDAQSMAQTFGAIAMGLANHRDDVTTAGVIANKLGSQRHQQLISESMPEDVPLLGSIKRNPEFALPERHLGLVHPHEIEDYDKRLDGLANLIEEAGLHELPGAVEFTPGEHIVPKEKSLQGIKIGIAKDDAFTFIYAANLKLLHDMGAEVEYFSPLTDNELPEVDALWLPGGYPELHHKQLSANTDMLNAVRNFCQSDKKVLAECGGMLYLMETLTDVDGYTENMVGTLPGHGIMRDRGGCQGMQTAPLPEGEIRAHAHHRTRCEQTAEPIGFGRRARHPAPGEPIYQTENITASYLHFYFPSNPEAIAQLFTD